MSVGSSGQWAVCCLLEINCSHLHPTSLTPHLCSQQQDYCLPPIFLREKKHILEVREGEGGALLVKLRATYGLRALLAALGRQLHAGKSGQAGCLGC